ncbi:MAG: hypothetical protein ACRDPC_05645 [Solirubrobacteraceae bacterium]
MVVRGGEYPELVVRGGLDRTARLRSEGLVLTDDTTVGAGAHHTLNRR